jgi:hypothetical protein
MARRRLGYPNLASVFVSGMVVGCLLTFLYLQISGVCQ